MSTPLFVWVTHPTGKRLVRPDNVVLSKTGALAVVRMNRKWKLTVVSLGYAIGAYFGHFTNRQKAISFMRDLDKLWGSQPDIQLEYMSRREIDAWNLICDKHNLPPITRDLLISQNIHTNWKGR